MKVKTISLLIFILFASLVFGQKRIVLLEQFTNASCPPCSENMPKLHDYIKHHFSVVPLQFHTWWPGSDPMYDYNIDENTDRVNYYDVWFVPWINIDGTIYGEPLDTKDIHRAIQERMEIPSVCDINIEVNKLPNDVQVDVRLIATEVPEQTNLKLRVAIIEREIFYDVGPGSIPGYNNFGAVMRKMLPSSNGEPVDFTAKNDTLNFQFTTPIDETWVLDEVYAVAWLQSDDTKEVIQSNINFPLFTVESNDSIYEFMSANSNVSKGYTITNDNDTPLNLRVAPIIHSNDANWMVKITKSGILYDELDLVVEPGQTVDFRLSVTSSNTDGEIDIDVFAQNLDDPHGYGSSYPFYALQASGGILFIDNDGGTQAEDRYLGILDNLGLSYALVDGNLFAPIFAEVDSLPFKTIIVSNGDFAPSIDTNTVNQFSKFLDDGGNMLITGQKVGDNIWDEGGSSNLPEVQSFYNNYLNADYIQGNSNIFSLEPVPENPLAADLTFSINTIYPDREPDAFRSFSKNSGELLKYTDSDMYGALLFEGEGFKTALLGFGIEQIIPRSKGDLLLTRIMEFFDMVTEIEETSGELPEFYQLSQNYPNPFNPVTSIKYSIPESGFVSLKIYDIMGKEVYNLVNEEKSAGHYKVDFNAEQLTSGIYFYTLKSGRFFETKKMILLK